MSKHQAVRQGTGRSGKRNNHPVVSTPRKDGNDVWPSEAPLICALGATSRTSKRREHRMGVKDADDHSSNAF